MSKGLILELLGACNDGVEGILEEEWKLLL